MRTFCLIVCLAASAQSSFAGEVRTRGDGGLDGIIVPDSNTDFSAYRVDADVYGWKKDFSQVAAIGMEVRRKPDSSQKGEAFLVVFPTDSVKPVHNVHSLYITQAAHPHHPVPLPDARDRMYGIDEAFQRLWPRRPKRKRPRGWMQVEMVWEKAQVSDTQCEPSIGFILRTKKETRFQPHQQLSDVRASCDLLRLTENRTYWGRRDVAVVMPRFDFGVRPRNEQSFRHPVSALWERARPLTIAFETTLPKRKRMKALADLKSYGRVEMRRPVSGPSRIEARSDLAMLGRRIARAFAVETVTLTDDGPDIRVVLTDEPSPPAPASPDETVATANELDFGEFASPQGYRKRR